MIPSRRSRRPLPHAGSTVRSPPSRLPLSLRRLCDNHRYRNFTAMETTDCRSPLSRLSSLFFLKVGSEFWCIRHYVCDMEFSVEALERDLNKMRKYYGNGKTKEASWRESQLKGLHSFVKEKEVEILKALKQDLGKHPAEAFRDEVGTLMKSLNLAIKSLKNWMAAKEAKLPKIALLSSAEIVPEPLGLVLIISSWNFPFGLSLEPLIGAVAAGNCVVLKPSEMAPACSSLLTTSLPNYLDNNGIMVIEGGPEVGELLLKKRWDKIFFTGSARVGRMVMSAAVEHLTPVTLELGGKCPALVDSLSSSWDREVAAKRILVAKYGACAGQACIAIDYVIVEKSFSSKLVEIMKEWMKKMFGENPKASNTIARIVNKNHFSRLKGLLDEPNVKESVVFGGSMDQEALFIEPTILLDPPLESAIMAEEIFGPLLPIITVEKIEDGIGFINSKPKPLAIYAFTKNQSLQKRMLSETSSGSIVFNDAILQRIPYHLEELVKVDVGSTMGSSPLMHLVTIRLWLEEVSTLIFGLGFLHGHLTSSNYLRKLTLLTILD